ncbi:hypothetical protein [Lentzea cavernae]|uniref:Uncharacterized protein n=1 Tax=Lentzea cavernae TaxID=2020703 RepID=A0ABQ3M4Y2_9PSEU|nr:hypothetical protein [Lentzea cavernae]GHH32666.1 hypothetical protein GCM10017774_13920 [Lentzea cavernae]
MTDEKYARLTADQRDAVKWVGSIVLGVATAAAGATTITRLGNVAEDWRWVLPTGLLLLAVAGIVLTATSIGWALAVPEPSLVALISKADRERSPRRGRWWRPQDRSIHDAVKEAGAEIELREGGLPAVTERVTLLEEARSRTLRAISTGVADDTHVERYKDAEDKLGVLYSELRAVTSAVRYVWVRDRVRWALSAIGVSAAITVAVIVGVVLLTVPKPTNANGTAVRVYFTGDTSLAKSPDGCVPAAVDAGWMTGGTWEAPVLVFEPGKVAVTGSQATSARAGNCDTGKPAWVWRATSGQVVLTPMTP